MDLQLIFNPIIVSVILLCILCLCKVNILLSLMLSAIAAGLISKMPITEIMSTFVSGMGENSETALSYILLGAFAAAMTRTGLAAILAKKIAVIIKSKRFTLLFILAGMAILSQNLIPVHIAFIPVVVPPLLHVMNKLRLDRRAAACALAFGLEAPYIAIPAGFGLIFHGLLADNMTQNGMAVAKNEVWQSTWILGVAMLVGLFIAIFIAYVRPRKYENIKVAGVEAIQKEGSLVLTKNHYITLLGAFATLGVQLWTGSLPLGALVGLGIIFSARAIEHNKMDKVINEGIGLMGYIAFVMLISAGFAAVLKSSGGIDALINSMIPLMQGSKLVAASIMLFVGLFITIGIGTSFGTIPILAVLFVPICANLGFSTAATLVILAAAAALGDAGSPASDTALGPTAGLNADGQHDHIRDTCVPTFIYFNIPLIIFALIAVLIF